jgi:hypothetical protein
MRFEYENQVYQKHFYLIKEDSNLDFITIEEVKLAFSLKMDFRILVCFLISKNLNFGLLEEVLLAS